MTFEPDVKYLFFDRFQNRLDITATLTAMTGFRVGRGRDEGAVATDLPVLALGDGRQVVPGSSIKGVVRSAAERYLRSMAPGDPIRWACDPLGPPRGDDGTAPTQCWPLKKQDRRQDDDESAGERAGHERDAIRAHICRACATFGANGLASHVRFADAVVQDGARRVRDGVGIDRDLGRARDGLKYDYEVVDPGATVALHIELENVEDWQIGLVLTVLADLDQGWLRLGGFGSRGLGWLAITDGPRVRRRTLAHVLARDPGEVEEGAALDKYHQAFARLAEVA